MYVSFHVSRFDPMRVFHRTRVQFSSVGYGALHQRECREDVLVRERMAREAATLLRRLRVSPSPHPGSTPNVQEPFSTYTFRAGN